MTPRSRTRTLSRITSPLCDWLCSRPQCTIFEGSAEVNVFPKRRSMRVTLKVIGGPHKGQVYTFAGHDTFLVGRSKRAHFRLPAKDRYFSRVHFLVEVNPPQCRLMDMNSRNGTFVNGQRVEIADLKDTDQIRAGHTILRVHVEETE